MQLSAFFLSLAMAASAFPLASINSEDSALNVDIAKRGDKILTSIKTVNPTNASEASISTDKRETASIDIARRTNWAKVLDHDI